MSSYPIHMKSAREIKREELGNLAVGAPADVAVLRLVKGDFGFIDVNGDRMSGNRSSWAN